MDKTELIDRQQTAEQKFNQLTEFLSSVAAKLKEFGVDTVEDAQVELHRLQGEYRLLNEQIGNTTPVEAETVEKAK